MNYYAYSKYRMNSNMFTQMLYLAIREISETRIVWLLQFACLISFIFGLFNTMVIRFSVQKWSI